jgi:hypothetical protein
MIKGLVRRSARVAAYLTVVGLVSGLVGSRVAHAKATDAAMDIGEKLTALDLGDGARELVLNGEHVRIATAQTAMPLHAVLDRLQAGCENDADGLATDLADLSAALERKNDAKGHAGIGLLRDERAGRGVVTCFATGEDSSMDAVRVRLGRFLQTHDLADVGRLRYMAARSLPEGGTLVVSTWTEGSLSLDALFPATGDAKGSDPSFAPRPAGRRLLSVQTPPAPYGLFVYAIANEAPDRVLARYEDDLTKRGFMKLPGAYHRGNTDVLVSVQREGDGSTLSVVETVTRQVQGGGK